MLDVVEGRSLADPRVFKVMEPGLADGLRVDENGSVRNSSLYAIDTRGRGAGVAAEAARRSVH